MANIISCNSVENKKGSYHTTKSPAKCRKEHNNRGRNTNVEILRLVLMIFICFWHVIVHGYGFKNFGESNYTLNTNIWITLFFCTLFSPATYCFMFISGWFGIKFSTKKFIYFCAIGLFCLFITIAIRYYLNDIDYWFPVATHLFPIACQKWWFLTCYVMVFLMAPFIEAGLNTLDKKTLRQVFYILTYIEVTSFIVLQDSTGRSFFGLLYIYFLARYLRKINFCASTQILFVAYIVSFITLWLGAYWASHLYDYKWISWVFVGSYNNPFIIIMAVATFFIVMKIKPNNIRWLNNALEHILTIYLITEGLGTVLYKYAANLISRNTYLGISFILLIIISCLAIGKLFSHIYSFSIELLIKKPSSDK